MTQGINIGIGRQTEYGSFLVCSACNHQIADGVPLPPEPVSFGTLIRRKAFALVHELIATLLKRPITFSYRPKNAAMQFSSLSASWIAESRARELERQGQKRPRENNLTVYAQPHDEVMKRSRLSVEARHRALLERHSRYVQTLVAVANGRIRRDEYGDEIWDAAKDEIDKVIDSKLFGSENIIGRGEFYSFEFLSRCEPHYATEYSDCWIFDELYDRLKSYHQQRLADLASGKEVNFSAMSGIEFEEWIIASIKQAGIPDARPTKVTGDQGADIIVRHGRTLVIQAKCYSHNVDNKAVQEAFTAKTHYNGDYAWVVTNSWFTRSAQEVATSTGVRLIDRSSVRDIGILVAEALNPASQFTFGSGRAQLPRENVAPTDAIASPPLAFAASVASTAVPDITSVPPPMPRSLGVEATTPSMPPQRTSSKRPLVLVIAACLVLAAAILYFYSSHRGKIDAENGTRKTLAAWTSTMLSNDLAGQVGCYAPIVEPFFQQPRVTIQVIADEKAKLMKTYPLVKQYAISNIDFQKIEPGIVQLSLDKTWDVQGI
jgi:hypothetical protein